jgi:hypothetical protein
MHRPLSRPTHNNGMDKASAAIRSMATQGDAPLPKGPTLEATDGPAEQLNFWGICLKVIPIDHLLRIAAELSWLKPQGRQIGITVLARLESHPDFACARRVPEEVFVPGWTTERMKSRIAWRAFRDVEPLDIDKVVRVEPGLAFVCERNAGHIDSVSAKTEGQV